MTKEILLSDFEQANEKLIDLLNQFSQGNFNKKPSANEWSAAEVAEHLVKVETSANTSLRAESSPANRPPDERISFLKERMENETKRVAPERVTPTTEPKDKPSLMNQLKEQAGQLREAIQDLDETEACTGNPHPSLGVMTRMEWVYFIIYHTERHLRQLKRLQEN